MKQYKVWIHIEEIDEDQDEYNEVNLPEEIGCFDTLQEAEDFAAAISAGSA